MTKEPVRQRPAARLLITDPLGRVLLFRFEHRTGALAGMRYWATPGGGVEGDAQCAAFVAVTRGCPVQCLFDGDLRLRRGHAPGRTTSRESLDCQRTIRSQLRTLFLKKRSRFSGPRCADRGARHH